jgi:acyl dehydratase
MTIDFETLRDWRFPEMRHTFTRRDTILYALGVGLGSPSTDAAQLPFVYEEALEALPTMANILGYRGFWLKDPATGVDWRRVLHGEHWIRLHSRLPVEGEVVTRQSIVALVDKGQDRGAVLTLRREVFDAENRPLATIDNVSLLRGDGGFGRSVGALNPLPEIPARLPDQIVELRMSERAALIYRLSGDYNPLHIDPEVARAAGFPRPIAHGLCTYGVIGHAVLRATCGYRAGLLRSLAGRFSAPVYPGETIRIELWDTVGAVAVRAWSVEREVVVFDRGVAEIEPSA